MEFHLTKWRNFVSSGLGHLEYKICETLHVTPKQLGKLREEDPSGISFIEQHIIWESNEKHKANQALDRKNKAKKGKRR